MAKYLNIKVILENFLRIPFIILIIALMLLLNPKSPAFADGMIMEVNQYGNEFNYYDEENQNAVISWENGMEKMVLVIGASENQVSDLVWIFPIPSEPDRIVLDILGNLPTLHGEEITALAQSRLDEAWVYMEATQIYTIPFILTVGMRPSVGLSALSNLSFDSQGAADSGVTVYEHIEKEGVTSELITARNAEGLDEYLREKGMEVTAAAIPVLDNYIGQDYSFVVSWMPAAGYAWNDPAGQMTQRGVYVTFPTDEIYFPLLPTSVYDSKVVPASIWVVGHVTPRLFGDIEHYVTAEYYINGRLSVETAIQNFYGGDTWDVSYTMIQINAPSKYLIDDLWMTRGLPEEKRVALFVATSPVSMTFVLIMLASVVAGIIAGLAAFGKRKVRIWIIALIGLANCLTILGTIIAIIFCRIGSIKEDAGEIMDKIRAKGYVSRRTFAAILFIYSVPFLLFGLFIAPLWLSGSSFEMYEILFIYVFPIIAFMSALNLMRVEKEDRELFKELKAKRMSVMFFQAMMGSKLAFLIMFSIFYLGISWALITVVRMFI